MRKNHDLIVVGAGILGISTALHAARAGLSVLILEKDDAPFGATRRNFGMIGVSTLAHPDSIWRRHALASVAFYKELQQQHDISFCRRDGLYLANTEAECKVLHEFATLSAQYDIPSEELSAADLRQKYAWLASDTLKGGLCLTEDYSVEPDRIGLALLELARTQYHVDIELKSCVASVTANADSISLTLADGRQFSAGRLVICHGANTDLLYPGLWREAGLQRCRLQMARTAPFASNLSVSLYSGLSLRRYPAFSICPSYAALEAEAVSELVTRHGIHVLIKQMRDGSLIIGDSHDYDAVCASPVLGQYEQVNQFFEDYIRENMGMKLPPIVSRWDGHYLVHPEQPVFTAEPDRNIHVISAIGGKGMTTGPGFTRHYLQTEILSG